MSALPEDALDLILAQWARERPDLDCSPMGVIGRISQLQREVFLRQRATFAEHGLDWRWDRDDYRRRLESSGGRDRIAEFARDRGEEVDADADGVPDVYQRDS